MLWYGTVWYGMCIHIYIYICIYRYIDIHIHVYGCVCHDISCTYVHHGEDLGYQSTLNNSQVIHKLCLPGESQRGHERQHGRKAAWLKTMRNSGTFSPEI